MNNACIYKCLAAKRWCLHVRANVDLQAIKGSREAAFDVRNAGWRLRNDLASARSVS